MPQIHLDPVHFLTYLQQQQHYSMQHLAKAICTRFQEWFDKERRHKWNQEAYLRHYYAKNMYDRIKATTEGKSVSPAVDIDTLVTFVRAVEMPFGSLIDSTAYPTPFERWKPGSCLAVCIAKRLGDTREGQAHEAQWPRVLHGARDVLALNALTNILQRKLRLDYQLRLELIDPVLPKAMQQNQSGVRQQARQRFAELRADPRIGAIVALGSGPYNPLSNVVQTHIFNADWEEKPVLFRWTSLERQQEDFLAEPTPPTIAPDQPAGILYQTVGGGKVFFPRVIDRQIVQQTLAPTAQLSSKFADCGLLAIDQRDDTVLILAAGHGGNGTLACIQALSETDIIKRYMGLPGQTHHDQCFYTAPGRFAHVVAVNRRKPTSDAVDDVELDT